MGSRLTTFFKNTFYGLLVCVMFFALLELVLFVFGVDHRQRNLKFQNKYHALENAPELPLSYRTKLPKTVWHNLIHNELCYPDVEYIFRVRGNPDGKPVMGYEGINASGFRGAFDLSNDKLRIAVLGNSCVFGWELHQLENTFAYKLEQKLNSVGQECSVFNLGQPGFSTTQCLKLYNEWKDKIKPDIVILYTGWNDVWPSPWLTDKQTMQALKVNNTWIVCQLRKMRTYAFMQRLVPDFNQESTVSDTAGMKRLRVPLEETRENLSEIIGQTQAIIILPPYCIKERENIEPYRAMVKESFSELAIVRLDSMEIAAPNTASYFTQDGFHPNEKGSEYIALRLADEIMRLTE